MEARRTFTESSVPKGLVIVVAACAALGLAAMGAAAVKGLGASSSVSTEAIVHPAAGTVLRQDNPVQGATLIDRGAERPYAGAPAGSHTGRTSGNQLEDPSAAGDSDYGSSADLTRALPVESNSIDFEPIVGYRAQ